MKQIKFLFAVILALSLISFAQALPSASVSVVAFYDATTETSLSVYQGDQVGITVDANSIFEKSMTVNVDLLTSSGTLVQNLFNAYTINDSYSKHYVFGDSIYGKPGNYIIRASVKSASGSTDTQDLYLEILEPQPCNHAPVITSTPITSVNEGNHYSYQVTATDQDNDPLTYSLTQNPSWISIDSNGLISGTAPLVDADYEYSITVQVSDGKDFTQQFYTLTDRNIILPDVNNPPVITSTPITQVNEKSQYNYQVTATDKDGDVLTYSLTQSPIWLSMSSNGLISGTAPEVNSDTGFQITIKVSDGKSFKTQYYTLTVKNIVIPSENHAPVITSTPITSVNEGNHYSYQVTATDQDNDPLTYSLTQNPSWISIDSNGLISGTAPLVDADYGYSITVKVSDGKSFVTQAYTLTDKDVLISDTTPPEITIISPQHKTYSNSNILFKITTNEPADSWFSLDNGARIKMDKNGNTFTYTKNVQNGDHTVTFYATDDSGNTGTKSISFSVDTQETDHKSISGGASSIRYLPDDSTEVQKKKIVVADEEPKKIVKKSEAFNWLWILMILFILAIIVMLLLILRNRY
jgi:hypothetical protein